MSPKSADNPNSVAHKNVIWQRQVRLKIEIRQQVNAMALRVGGGGGVSEVKKW